MSVEDTISHVVDKWFLYEPLLFNVYCTHRLEENTEMSCAFRSGKRRIEYNPDLLEGWPEKDIEMGLKIEVTRILLKHPYQRVPPNPNRNALKTASDITISESCFTSRNLIDAEYYKLEKQLSYEEYYKKLYYICPESPVAGSGTSAEGEENEEDPGEAAELWDEDEEIVDSVNQQILKAQRMNQWGSISGEFQELVTASLKVPMDYRRILSQFRASIISQRRTLTRMKPNRRYNFDYMGSKFEPKTHLLVAVDVSGSIGSEDLQNFFSIINRFFSYGVEAVQVLAFDTEIKQEFELKKAAKSVKIAGRGGTDFQCAIDYYEKHAEYQGLIIFTDGYASVPKIKSNKQILWILTRKEEYDVSITWIKKFKNNRATWIPQIGK